MILDRFKRLNQSVSPELIGDDELVTLENAVLDDETGKPKKRGGIVAFNSNQIDSTSTVTSLHDVMSPPDGATASKNYLLAGINSKLRKSLDGTGTWSDVTDKGVPPYRMESYADGLIFTEGSVAPFMVRGNTLGTVVDLEIAPIDATDIFTGTPSVATGNMEEGYYKHIFCYVTETGELSPPCQPIAHHIDAGYLSTDATHKRIGFANIPASTDDRVTGIRVFRTLKTGNIFYYVTQLANETQNWFDDISDNDLGAESIQFLNCPLTSEYIVLHKDRIWQGYIKRTVKNWDMPAWSAATGAGFNATAHGVLGTFTDGVPFRVRIIAGVGTLAAGDYTYRIIYVDADGLMSDPTDSNTLTISATNNIRFDCLPSINDLQNIVRADVYRDIDGAGFFKIFDYVPSLTNVLGTALTLEDQGYTDGTAYVTNQTTETTKTGLAFSDIGEPASYPLENLRNIYPDDGDEITGLFDDIDGLLIFKKNSICKIYTSGSPAGWRLVKLLDNIGSNEPYSIAKYGSTYFFVHYNKIYKFNSSGYEDIGEGIKDILDNGYTFYSSTVSKRWYILGVSISSSYRYFVYDMMLQTWYIFSAQTTPYILTIKEHGTNTGKILMAYAQYLLYYGTGATDINTNMTDPLDITPVIRTKTFRFEDGISLARLRKLEFNYKKLDDENVVITIVNPDSGVTNTYTDSTNATLTPDWKNYEPSFASDSLTVTPKLYINVTGAGLTEWGSLRLEVKPVNRGTRV